MKTLKTLMKTLATTQMIFNIIMALFVKELVDIALLLFLMPWYAWTLSWIAFGVAIVILYLQGENKE